MRKPVRRLLAAHQQSSQPIELPERETGEAQEPSRNQGSEREQPIQQRRGRSLRVPAKPANDAAVAVKQRLNLPPIAGRIVVEAQVLEARGALQRPDQRWVKTGNVG